MSPPPAPPPAARRSPAPYRRSLRSLAVSVGALALAACDGPQSALDPAGVAAERVATLWWWMAAGAALLWAAVVGLTLYAVRVRPERHDEAVWTRVIVGGGAVLPVVVLTALLLYGLSLLPALVDPEGSGALRVEVVGEQWWWRVRYITPAGDTVEAANEVRLPVGERVGFTLSSPDVIHSFWIPSLAGKLDMIPGRITRMALEPTRTGIFRGQCAEFCGTSHALMAFPAVVLEAVAFDAWLAAQARPAAPPATPLAARGARAFAMNGCGACHSVRGTAADGAVGPDLTHVGSRLTLAAGTLPNEPEAFQRWIAHPPTFKPGVHMPAFGMLPEADLRALAVYMESLK